MLKNYISIIIPCYNDGQYLQEAVDSVERCDKSLYEMIIVNDGSSDEYTNRILEQLAFKGYKIINQENGGLGAARNTGINAATGDYILPLDADNKIYPNYLEKGLKILQENVNIGVVYGKRDFLGEVSDDFPQARELNVADMLLGNYIDACAVIRKSDLIKCHGYSTNFPCQGLEDWDLWLSLISLGVKFHFLDEIAYSYRIRSDSISHIMNEAENKKNNLNYLYSKHQQLLIQTFSFQNQELALRKRLIPFWMRQVYWKFRYKTSDFEKVIALKLVENKNSLRQ